MHYGYIRLSCLYSDPQEQIDAIGLPEDVLYIDDYPRPELYFPQRERLLRKVKEGDTIHVKSIDRFFMTVAELKILLASILKKKVILHSHAENLIIGGETLNDFAETFLQFSFCLDYWERTVQSEYEEEMQCSENTQEPDASPTDGKNKFLVC